MRKVEVATYNPVWPEEYEKAAAEIRSVLGGHCLAIHHIGSTAVPGLAAKPVIDILVEADQLSAIGRLNEKFQRIGFCAKGENGLPGRRYFEKGGDLRTHHLHCYVQGNPEIKRHLAFRDFLRSNPEQAAAYGTLKKQLAVRFPLDIERYIKEKHAMVQSIEAQALGEIG